MPRDTANAVTATSTSTTDLDTLRDLVDLAASNEQVTWPSGLNAKKAKAVTARAARTLAKVKAKAKAGKEKASGGVTTWTIQLPGTTMLPLLPTTTPILSRRRSPTKHLFTACTAVDIKCPLKWVQRASAAPTASNLSTRSIWTRLRTSTGVTSPRGVKLAATPCTTLARTSPRLQLPWSRRRRQRHGSPTWRSTAAADPASGKQGQRQGEGCRSTHEPTRLVPTQRGAARGLWR